MKKMANYLTILAAVIMIFSLNGFGQSMSDRPTEIIQKRAILMKTTAKVVSDDGSVSTVEVNSTRPRIVSPTTAAESAQTDAASTRTAKKKKNPARDFSLDFPTRRGWFSISQSGDSKSLALGGRRIRF